jgi:uncharacterized repeat protein (TIGR03837 family)
MMDARRMNQRWDIFCHVVDNYGDAGVCWRLARQLADEFDLNVRLWIDDLAALRKLCPEIVADLTQQIVAGVTVCRWLEPLPQPVQAADVVIEAFACELPETYRAAMRVHRSLWINLEYLSAESWVSDCHGLPSPQPRENAALKKFFFFPGFRPNTGGVLGERDLPRQRRAFQSDPASRDEFLRQLNIEPCSDFLWISLFAYRHAAIESLLKIWSRCVTPMLCLVPEGQPLSAVAKFCGENLCVGAVRTKGALTIAVLPFLSQYDYDRLLWSCDLNFVRGEDSFVRAQWAARPFVWHIYAQEEGAHWPKLDAFLNLYGESDSHGMDSPPLSAMRNFWHAWNGNGDMENAWRAYIEAMPELRAAAEKWALRLESGTNLASALVQFCANQV